MTRTEWLITLETELKRLGILAAREIVADYEEHFTAGVETGKSEEEICAKLGDPRVAARAHHAESLVTQAAPGPGQSPSVSSVLGASLRLLVLTPLTFLMLVGPFLFISLFLVTGWGLTILFGGVTLGGLVAATIALPFIFVSFWGVGALIFGALSVTGMTILAGMTMWVITKWTLMLFVSYLRWNVDFVLEK